MVPGGMRCTTTLAFIYGVLPTAPSVPSLVAPFESKKKHPPEEGVTAAAARAGAVGAVGAGTVRAGGGATGAYKATQQQQQQQQQQSGPSAAVASATVLACLCASAPLLLCSGLLFAAKQGRGGVTHFRPSFLESNCDLMII